MTQERNYLEKSENRQFMQSNRPNDRIKSIGAEYENVKFRAANYIPKR